MSTTVDTRVVEMKFNNQRFRENIQETVDSLKELDKSLKLEDASKGLEAVAKTAQDVASPLTKAVDTVKLSFSALEVAAITVFTNIVNKAVNAGEKIVKALTVDNIISGWKMFEEITNNSAILVKQGNSMDSVNETLSELKFLADETSYSISNFTDIMGKFSAKTGFTMERAKKVSEGIALWGATAGQTASVVNRVSMQIAQVSDYVKAMDWMSIRTNNLDTAEAMQLFIDKALQVGTLTKHAEGQYKTLKGHILSTDALFTDGLKDGWLSMEVFAQGLENFSDAVKAVDDYMGSHPGATASEAIRALKQEMGDAAEYTDKFGNTITQLGIKAFEAAQEARTWTDVIGSLKATISSQWENVFTSIIGDYEEAKDLYTGLVNLFIEMFASGAYERSDVFEFWKDLGGRTVLIDALAAGLLSIKDTIDSIVDLWNDLKYGTADLDEDTKGLARVEKKATTLYNITAKLREVLYGVAGFLNQNRENILSFFGGIFNFIGLIKEGITGLFRAILPKGATISSIFQVMMNLLGVTGQLLNQFVNWARSSNIAAVALNALSIALKGFQLILIGIAYGVTSLIAGVSSLVKSLDQLGVFNAILSGLKIGLSALITIVSVAISLIFGLIEAGKSALSYIKKMASSIKEFLVGIKDYSLEDKIKAIGQEIGRQFSNIKTNIQNRIANIRQMIETKFPKTTSFLKAIFGGVDSTTIVTWLTSIRDAITKLFDGISIQKLIALAFTFSTIFGVLNISSAFRRIAGGLEQITELIRDFRKALQKDTLAGTIYKIASAIAVLAGSLYLLSTVEDTDKLRKVTASLITLLTSITGLFLIITVVSKLLNFTVNIKNIVTGSTQAFSDFTSTILGLSGAILAIATAMTMLTKIESVDGLFEKMKYIYSTLGWVVLIATISSVISSITKGANVAPFMTILAISLSLNKIVEAIGNITKMDTVALKGAVEGLIPIITALGILCMGAGQINVSTALGLMIIFDLLEKILPEISKMETLVDVADFSKLLAVKEVMYGLFGMLMIFALKGSDIGKATRGITGVLLATTGIVLIMGYLTSRNFRVSEDVLIAMSTLLQYIGTLEVLSFFTRGNKMTGFALGMLILTGVISRLIDLVDEINLLGINRFSIKPLSMLFEEIQSLMMWSALTKFAKTGAIISIFAGLYILFGYIVTLSAMNDTGAITNACNNMINVITAVSGLIGMTLGMIAMIKHVSEGKDEGTALEKAGAKLIKAFATVVLIAGLGYSVQYVAEALRKIDALKNPQNVIQNAISLGLVMVALAGSVAIITAAFKKVDWSDIAKTVVGGLGSLALVIGSLYGVVGALYILDSVDADKAEKNAWTLSGIIGAFSVLVFAFSKLVKEGDIWSALSGAASVGLLALSLIPMASALVKLNEFVIDESTIKRLVALGVAVGVVAGIGTLLGLAPDKTGAGMLILALGLISLASSILIVAHSYDILADSLERMQNLDSVKPLERIVEAISDNSKIALYGDQIYRSYYELGKQTIQGMYDAMTNEEDLSLIDQAARGLIDTAISVPKEYTDKGSSSEFYNIGSDIDQELSDGMTENADKVENAAKNTSSRAILGIGYGAGMGVGTDNSAFNIGQRITEWLGEGIGKKAQEIKDKWFGGVSLIENLIGLAFNKDKGGATSGLGDIAGNLDKWIGSGVTWLSQHWSGLLTDAKQLLGIDDILEQVKGALNFDLSSVTSQLDEYGTYFKTFMEDFAMVDGESKIDEYLDKLTGSLGNVGSSMSDATKTAEEAKDVYTQVAESVKNACDAFSEFNNEITKTPEDMLKALQSDIVGMTQWSNNVIRVAAKGLDPVLLKELTDKGPSAFAEVAAYAQMSVEQIEEVNKAYKVHQHLMTDNAWPVTRALQYSAEMLLNGSSTALDEFSDVVGTTVEGLETVEDVAEQTTSVFEDMSNSVISAADSFSEFNMSTEDTAEQMLKNMESQIVGMSKWADNIAILAKKGLNFNLLKELGDLGPSGYSKVAAYAKMTVDQIAEANKAYLKKGAISKEVPNEIVKAYQYAGEMARDGFSNALDEYDIDYDPLTEGLDEVVETVEEAGEQIKSVFESVGESIASIDLFSEFNLQAEKSFDDVFDALKTNVFAVAEWSNNITRLAARGLNDDILDELVNKGATGSFQEVNALIQATDEQLREYNNTWQIAKRQSSSAALQVTKSLQYAAETGLNGFSKALQEYQGIIDMDPMFDELFNEAKRAAGEDEEVVIKIGEDTINAIKEGMETNITSVHNLVKSAGLENADFYADGFNRNIESFLNGLYPEIIDPKTKAISDSNAADWETAGHLSSDSYSQTFTEGVSEFLDSLWPETMQPKSESIKDNMLAAWEDYARSSVDTYSSYTAEELTAFLQSLYPDYMDPALTGIEKEVVAKSGSVGANGGRTFGDEYKKKAKEEMENAKPELVSHAENIGYMVAEGITSGIRKGTERVKEATQGMVSKIDQTAREHLLIESPSKVMAEIGNFVAEGLAVGITAGTPEVESTASTMANLISTVVDNALDYLNDNDTLQPVLTPILDLSEIQNGANELDSYFSTKQVAIASSKFNENIAAKRSAQVEFNTSRIEEAIGRYAENIVSAINNTDKSVNVDVKLQGDSAKLFNVIRKENSKFTKINGYNALS